MGMSPEDDPSTQGQRLSCRMRKHQLLKLYGFFIGQGDGIAGFGTTHGVAPPAPSLSFPHGVVKLGTYLRYAVLSMLCQIPTSVKRRLVDRGLFGSRLLIPRKI